MSLTGGDITENIYIEKRFCTVFTRPLSCCVVKDSVESGSRGGPSHKYDKTGGIISTILIVTGVLSTSCSWKTLFKPTPIFNQAPLLPLLPPKNLCVHARDRRHGHIIRFSLVMPFALDSGRNRVHHHHSQIRSCSFDPKPSTYLPPAKVCLSKRDYFDVQYGVVSHLTIIFVAMQ
ncbi:hypothetical protein CHS0354_036509, partial [Potamilus streckersoni]